MKRFLAGVRGQVEPLSLLVYVIVVIILIAVLLAVLDHLH